VNLRARELLASACLFQESMFLTERHASELANDAATIDVDPAKRMAHLRGLARSDTTTRLRALVTDEDGHTARLLVDPFRKVARRFGVPLAWPGTRVLERDGRRTARFQYWGEEALDAELLAARLRVVSRKGETFEVEAIGLPQGEPIASALQAERSSRFWEDVIMAVAYMPRVRTLMQDRNPEVVFERARRIGMAARVRGATSDLRVLRRAISWADYLVPGGGCLRRTVLELCMDGGSARKTVHMGIDIGKTGHAWVDGDTRAPLLDAVFSLDWTQA
jgi:hypothetical protein